MIARDMGCPVACLPGLTMRRMADFYPGDTQTGPECFRWLILRPRGEKLEDVVRPIEPAPRDGSVPAARPDQAVTRLAHRAARAQAGDGSRGPGHGDVSMVS
ncbi:hypothetical protein ACZ91_27785 [Streptomyces regensis]|nr:hypothetical protein ACZ91_27785 [Streptomyces regensis]